MTCAPTHRGNVWYSNFVENFLGELDPKTGENRDYPIPVLKPGSPTGTLDLEADADGNLWLAMMFQTGLAKFDMATKTFQIFPVQAALNDDATQQSMVMPRSWQVDGKVWSNDVARQSIMRLDLKTGQYELIDPFKFLAGSSARALRHGRRRAKQSLFHGFRRREYRPRRCQDRRGNDLSDADAEITSASHHAR